MTEKPMAEIAAAKLSADGQDFAGFAEAVRDCDDTTWPSGLPDGSVITRHEFPDGSALVDALHEWGVGFTTDECRDPDVLARVELVFAPHFRAGFMLAKNIPAMSMAEIALKRVLEPPDFKVRLAKAVAGCHHTSGKLPDGREVHRHEFDDGSAIVDRGNEGEFIGYTAAECRDPKIIEAAKGREGLAPEFAWPEEAMGEKQ